MLDPDNKVMHARIKVNNPGNLLKPQMFANIRINARSGENLPFVYSRSLVFDNDKNYVLVLDSSKPKYIYNRCKLQKL